MSNIEHSDDAVIDFIDAWAQDYANDAWRELSGADQLREGRRIMAAAQPRGAVEALQDAIAAVAGPVRHMPRPTYTPQVSVERVERWRAAAGGQ